MPRDKGPMLSDTPWLPYIVESMASGIPLNDYDEIFKIRQQLRDKREHLASKWAARGVTNLGSSKQLDDYLGNALPRTDKGSPSINKDNRLELELRFPDIRDHFDYKDTSSLGLAYLEVSKGKNCIWKKTYHSPTYNRMAGFPSYKVYGTRTSRGAYREFCLNQIPKDKKELDHSMRHCFVAPKGWTLVGIDVVALEYAILAYVLRDLCGNPRLLKSIQEGKCPKQMTLDAFSPDDLFRNIPEADKKSTAKTVNYAKQFGGGSTCIAYALKLEPTPEICSQVEQALERRFPSLRDLDNLIKAKINKRSGKLVNYYGREVYAISYAKDRETPTSAYIQSTGSDFCKMLFAILLGNCKDTYGIHDVKLALFNHDEVQVLIHRENVTSEEVQYQLDKAYKDYKEKFPQYNLFSILDYEIGKTWEETH